MSAAMGRLLLAGRVAFTGKAAVFLGGVPAFRCGLLAGAGMRPRFTGLFFDRYALPDLPSTNNKRRRYGAWQTRLLPGFLLGQGLENR
jgi:hypothetical protein